MPLATTRTALALVLFAAGCDLSPPQKAPSEPGVRELKLDGLLAESPEADLFSGSQPTHHELLERLEAMRDDDDVRGLVLHVGALEGAFARAAELTDALQALRQAKKPVHCYVEMTDNVGYMVLARGCDRISMAPGGMLDLVGVGGQFVFAKELLDTAGVRADLVQIGRYKGAADPLTRTEMAPEVRSTSQAMITDLSSALVDAIAEGRKLPHARARALLDEGPFTSEAARAHGLVDAVAFDDETRTHAKQAAKVAVLTEEPLRKARDEDLGVLELIEQLMRGPEQKPVEGARIALAYLEGTIMGGREGVERSAHAEPFVAAMRRLADEAEVRAVVLRIDSPGGSALAADAMWHAVRRVAKRKPVIVSIGDLAASGGYYVASAGTRILAEDTSLVGSIGVVGGKIVLEPLRERLGVHVERITEGKRAGWLSALHAFNDDERLALTKLLQSTYDRFLARIAEGRGVPRDRIDPLAEGRMMTARRAREGGLVDAEGGLRAALALARKEGKVDADSAIEIWPRAPSLFDQLSQLTSGQAKARASVELVSLGLPDALRAGLVTALLTGADPVLAVLPFAFQIH